MCFGAAGHVGKWAGTQSMCCGAAGRGAPLGAPAAELAASLVLQSGWQVSRRWEAFCCTGPAADLPPATVSGHATVRLSQAGGAVASCSAKCMSPAAQPNIHLQLLSQRHVPSAGGVPVHGWCTGPLLSIDLRVFMPL